MKKIHFIGICGVAMSALAIAFKKAGYTITGSDVGFYPPVSTNLKDAGVDFYPGWHPDLMTKNGAPDLVIVGNVAGSNNPEWKYVQDNKIPYQSYPEVLRDKLIKTNSIVCAGTFGKSTSTTILAYILTQAGLNPSYMFGSVSRNNMPPAFLSNSDWSVVEGDEYKASRWDNGPKFSYYKPTHLLLTSVVWDHADVYPTEKSYVAAFQKLVDSMSSDKTFVISEKALPIIDFKNKPIITYGKLAGSAYAYSDVVQSPAGVSFTIRHGKEVWHLVTTCLGEYMADNITGCFALAHQIGIAPEKIIAAVKNFAGVRRRLEKRYENGLTVFDTIAHSPQKAQADLASLRAVYKGRITAVFEPNIGNREQQSAPGYAHAFRDADKVIIPHLTKLKVDASKPDVMDGAKLASVIGKTHPNVTYIDDDQKLVAALKEKTRPNDVVVFLGSHGFRGMIENLVESFK